VEVGYHQNETVSLPVEMSSGVEMPFARIKFALAFPDCPEQLGVPETVASNADPVRPVLRIVTTVPFSDVQPPVKP
jgi:hypothetical protein